MKELKAKYRGGYHVEFPLSSFAGASVYYRGITIHQKIRQHDTAVIRVRTRRLDWFTALGENAPVIISYWNKNKIKEYFVGYVTHTRPIGNSSEGYERDIICVAASRELRKTDRRTYHNLTSPEIVQKIGKAIGFKVVTKQHGLRRPTVVHNGNSYWEFLTKLAKRTGYVLRVEQTTIFFLPLKDMVDTYASRSPMLFDYGGWGETGYSLPNVIEMDGWLGKTSDDPENLSDAAVFTSINPSTGEVVSVGSLPTSVTSRSRSSQSEYIRYPDGMAAHSKEDAKLLAKGAADNGLMAIETKMTVGGDTGLTPYHPVNLTMKDSTLNGRWIVKEATHTISKSVYHTDIVIGTDSLDGLPRSAKKATAPIRDLNTEAAQGFSPDLVVNSRLSILGAGVVLGVPGPNGKIGKWVAR